MAYCRGVLLMPLSLEVAFISNNVTALSPMLARGCLPMLMLDLQMNPYVSDLALYDIQGTPGVAADISHINSKAKTKVT